MLKRLLNFFSEKFRQPRVGIDLGTANSLVYVEGKGIVLREPTVIAIDAIENRILAVGNEARYMLGKNPKRILIERPIRQGVIANIKIMVKLLRYFLQKALGKIWLQKPLIMVSAPLGITSVEKRAVIKAAYIAGAGQVFLIPEPLAAALGAGMPIHESLGNMIVNMGGGTTEIAVISLNGIVVGETIRVAGDALNAAIAQYIKREKGVIIGEQMAEQIKISIGTAIVKTQPDEMEASGRDFASGLPKKIVVNSNEVRAAIMPKLEEIITGIQNVLRKTPPELAADIKEYGIMLSGGTALLEGLDELLQERLGVPVYVAKEPLLCVVRGTQFAIQNFDILKKNFVSL